MGIGILQSASRSATIIFFLYLLYYLSNSSVKNKLVIILLCIIGFAIVFSNLNFTALFDKLKVTTSDGSMEHRITAYSIFLTVFSTKPIFGVGLGNTYNVLNDYLNGTFRVNTFDNALLDFTLASGIIGFVGLVLIIIGLVKHKKHLKASLFSFAGIIYIVISLFLNTTKYQSLWGMIWIYLSLSCWLVVEPSAPFEENKTNNDYK